MKSKAYDLLLTNADKVPPDQQPAAERLENIVKLIMVKCVSRKGSVYRDQLRTAILSALRDRDERAVRIIDEHQAMDVCEDNCWTTIKAAIRKAGK